MLSAMPTDDAPGPGKHMASWAIWSAVGFVAAHLIYYWLAPSHFNVHFSVCAGVCTLGMFVARLQPRAIGHLIPTVFGIGYVLAAVVEFRLSAPRVLCVAMLVLGGVMLVLTWRSYRLRSRPAWGFLVAICGVCAAAQLFGAPKTGHALDINIWTALIVFGLFVVADFALVWLRSQYVEPAEPDLVTAP
jgi:hypothetical protein